ncbi:hypothetical protein [uncultured Turicimonas sp.]|uniref:hypothetical protein n=2 Tax=Sutterellaceae TaxID=995019 RepID=UPI0028047D22|nr:hypothetical protein [uncultured Turicimonas sp.]
MQSKKLLYSILTGAFTAFVLTGCGATKPPTPSGIRVPVTEFAQQRQKEAMQKKEEAKLNFGKDRVTRNFSFGYENQDNE